MPALSCPICHSALADHDSTCPSCHARRAHRKGMSPRGFTAYAALWLACTAVIAVLALRIALAPWLPSGSAPEYALALFCARQAAEPAGCRITLRDLRGQQIQTVVAGSCADAEAVAAQAPAPQREPGQAATSLQRRIASGLHSVLALGLGVLLAWLLRIALRRTFSRHASTTTWVLRARA